VTEDANPIPQAPAPPASGRRLIRLATGFYAIVALFAVGYALFSGTVGTLLGERAPDLTGLLGAVAIAALLVLITRLGSRAWKPLSNMTDELTDLIGPLTVPQAIVLALLSGVSEELLFRGALWPHLGLWTTLLFGLVHVLPRRRLWVYPVFATVAGLLLGVLRAGRGSVVPAMLAHVLVNAVNLAWLGGLARKRAAPAPALPTAG
jgi:membrane protease YdiL (CAAX protease family)